MAMSKKISLVQIYSLIAVILLGSSSAHAVIVNFVIQGTYDETLMNSTGTAAIFSAGDTFSVSGSYDTTLQPAVETKGNGIVTMVDGGMVDYSRVVSLTHNIPLAAINANYPSAAGGIVTGFSDGDVKNGAYITNYSIVTTGQNLDIYSDFTHIFLRTYLYGSTTVQDGWLEYNFHEEVTPSGPLTHYDWVHDTIALNITSFQTSVVPIPAAIYLFGTGLAGLLGLRFRLKRAVS
jgi:hypothetical protein